MRPIGEALAFGGPLSAPVRAASAGAISVHKPRVLLRGERGAGRGLARLRSLARPAPRGFGVALALALLLVVAMFGAVRGGQYQAFIAREGDLREVIARAIGFDIAIVTISGQAELREREILDAAQVTPKSSLLFLDAAEARRGLESLPLV